MICRDCGADKPPGDFPRDRNTKSGFHPYCKACHNQRHRDTLKRLYAGSTRHYHLQQKYGLGADDVADLISRQDGKCAICRTNPATQVDHDHRSRKVRGVLCLDCTAGLGAFKDDVRLIYEAVDYLHPVQVGEWLGNDT